ncbi:MAG TPA: sugar ABC transporter permease [Candidatus Limnocylindrales bacterium]|nr:sugar ABC transporter permease [Candidatus Limnocylindrales bacterium]
MTTVNLTKATARTSRAATPGPGHRRPWTPFLFLVVPVGLLLLLTYLPLLFMVQFSVFRWDGFSSDRTFVGPQNYIDIFTRPELFGVFFVSLYYFAASFVQIGVALYLATLLSFKVRFKNVFKGIIFFPYLINGVAIALIFTYFFRPDGVLDSLLAIGGVNDPPLWLGDRRLVNISLAGVSVWRYMGLNFVLFLGAIQSIPSEMLEAGEIDGASRWQRFRYLIAPGIRPVIALSFILAISGSLAVFEIPFIMLFGANGSATFVIQTVQTAFTFHKFGLAAAMAAVLLGLVLLVTLVQRRLLPDDPVELTV